MSPSKELGRNGQKTRMSHGRVGLETSRCLGNRVKVLPDGRVLWHGSSRNESNHISLIRLARLLCWDLNLSWLTVVKESQY